VISSFECGGVICRLVRRCLIFRLVMVFI